MFPNSLPKNRKMSLIFLIDFILQRILLIFKMETFTFVSVGVLIGGREGTQNGKESLEEALC